MSFIVSLPGSAAGLTVELLATVPGAALLNPGLPFGVAQGGRYLVAAITAQAGSFTSVATCTIGGVAANIVASVTNNAGGSPSRTAAVAIAEVPTGNTGSVNFTVSGGFAQGLVNLYSLFGLSAAAAARIGTSVGNSPSVSLAVKKGGVAIAAAIGTALSSPSSTWSNLIKDDQYAPTSLNLTAAHNSFNADQTMAMTCSFAGTSVSGCAGAFAVFDP